MKQNLAGWTGQHKHEQKRTPALKTEYGYIWKTYSYLKQPPYWDEQLVKTNRMQSPPAPKQYGDPSFLLRDFGPL